MLAKPEAYDAYLSFRILLDCGHGQGRIHRTGALVD